MGWPLAASKLFVLVFWKSVCGFDLNGISFIVLTLEPDWKHSLLHNVLVAEGAELLRGRRLDLV